MFYTFCQNNSGGYIIRNEIVDIYVIIEGHSANDIKRKANKLFKYYSQYCECCGKRWEYWFDDSDLDTEPRIDNKSVREYKSNHNGGKKIIIHYDNGKIESIKIPRKTPEPIDNNIYNFINEKNKLVMKQYKEEFIFPQDISVEIKSAISTATRKGIGAISFSTDYGVVFNKENISSNVIHFNQGAKEIHKKSVLFKRIVDYISIYNNLISSIENSKYKEIYARKHIEIIGDMIRLTEENNIEFNIITIEEFKVNKAKVVFK
ncbi:hypothetical protein NMJ53_012705 [Clostridioides difficile]|nr:hypothetical protein [Clostridioides difficile]MBG0082154.1 hypothetical protein [Clostridioides difficile]MBY1699474.1 hypothetical protein [Clostridioides difficile]MBZ0630864.1 hypothetical protein [Clostridioides difficile]MBZ0654847.1 hypothetical protein [Clostridioides difficile]